MSVGRIETFDMITYFFILERRLAGMFRKVFSKQKKKINNRTDVQTAWPLNDVDGKPIKVERERVFIVPPWPFLKSKSKQPFSSLTPQFPGFARSRSSSFVW